MTRPIPLTNLASGRPSLSDHQTLTPRTPHSRSGRAEEGFTEIELEQIEQEEGDDYRDYAQQQSEPFLVSSTTTGFSPTGYRSRGDDYDHRVVAKPNKFQGLTLALVCSRLPLVIGIAVAFFLFILVVVAMREPAKLQEYMGDTEYLSPTTPLENEDVVPPVPTTGLDHEHTISYENYTDFPLTGMQYRAECQKLNHGFMSHGEFWGAPMHGLMDVPHVPSDRDYGIPLPEGELTKICSSTITYQLDGNVGLLSDLALMAQAAAFAQERNRTFLIDDTYWNRGKWTDHFQDVRSRQPGPEPGCRAPPPEELVACPRLARHWVINSQTAKFHLGNGFLDQYENPYAHFLNRVKPIFQRSLTAFNETIRPNAHTAALIRLARAEMGKKLPTSTKKTKSTTSNVVTSEATASHTPSYVGVHVRRGDLRATSWSFHKGYVPINNYAQAALETWTRIFPSSSVPSLAVYIASDSPSADADLKNILPPNVSILSLSRSANPELKVLASPKEYVQNDFNGWGEEERKNATTGMIVDFAMVSGMWAWKDELIPEATVCTIGSNVCRMSAVGLGWDRAFGAVNDMGAIDEKGKRWVEIDNRDTVTPIWSAFQLFY